MQIDLFTCSAEHNRINKASYISNQHTLTGSLKAPTSAMNVIIEIEKTSNPLTYDYNYMYIGAFKRWYFINDIVNKSANRWEIHGTVDVLYTYKNDILGSNMIIDKAENVGAANLYLDDGSFVMDSRKYNEIKTFSSGFNDGGSYILICAGG